MKPIYWPLAVILLALAGLASLALLGNIVLKTIREVRHTPEDLAKLSSSSEDKKLGEEIVRPATVTTALDRYLTERSQDIKWLIESAAQSQNEDTLKKLLGLFSSIELSKHLSLNAIALRKLSQISIESREATSEDVSWLNARHEPAGTWERINCFGPVDRTVIPPQVFDLFFYLPIHSVLINCVIVVLELHDAGCVESSPWLDHAQSTTRCGDTGTQPDRRLSGGVGASWTMARAVRRSVRP